VPSAQSQNSKPAAPPAPAPPRILALWSAPRSRSTAFFRMMAERGDFAVVHEPFSYLAEFGETSVDGASVRGEPELIGALRRMSQRSALFFKDTTDERYPGLLADERFLREDAVHTFLIRDPHETIPSYFAINPQVRRHQIGLEALHEIFTRVAALTGRTPLVLDAADLVADPAAVVSAYCERVGIPYRPEALTWAPGARDEWRPSARWHEAASASSGFHADSATARQGRVDAETHPVLRGYLEHHLPYYATLRERRLTVPALATGNSGLDNVK